LTYEVGEEFRTLGDTIEIIANGNEYKFEQLSSEIRTRKEQLTGKG
jgi:hypothetical protein